MAKEIASLLHLRPATVCKWRIRFSQHRMAGLADGTRPGKPRTYDAATERRILAQLDEPLAEAYATWTGRLVAAALGNVSVDGGWRLGCTALRKG